MQMWFNVRTDPSPGQEALVFGNDRNGTASGSLQPLAHVEPRASTGVELGVGDGGAPLHQTRGDFEARSMVSHRGAETWATA